MDERFTPSLKATAPDGAFFVSREELGEKLVKLPRLNLTDRQLCDLELLLVGGFAPLGGFHTQEEYESVVERMRLPDGTLWPMPITLATPAGRFQAGEELVLCDRYGNPLAFMDIQSVWTPDRIAEAQRVLGSTDTLHPGVRHLMREERYENIGGRIRGIALPSRHDFRDLRKTPAELTQYFAAQGFSRIVGFQTRNPVHRAHAELMRRAAREYDAHVLMHPVVGLTREEDIDYITRVRAYRLVRDTYLADIATLALLPLAMRMAGPREALWHALIRKNYGCTHFIIGRDHAGPGKDSAGNDFYAPYAAHELAKEYEDEAGITFVTMPEMAYVEEEDAYLTAPEIKPQHTVKKISGTEVRRMLRAGEELPTWFSFPETIHELKRGVEREKRRGYALFFTGLPGAGKSTIAQIVYTKLLELQDRAITYLDGDVVRTHLSKGLGFSKEDRLANIERIGFVANEVVRHGGIAICSAVSPYNIARENNRALIERHGTYIEVYVATPVDECERRDVKGDYKRARAGELKGFTGVDDPYEAPERAELVIDTLNQTPDEAAERVIAYVTERGLL